MSPDDEAPKSDRLLWALGGGVVLFGVVFFAFLNMGTPESDTSAASLTTQPAATEDSTDTADEDRSNGESIDFSVQLNRARLAVDANMLTEPEGYSAWSIYLAIVDADADNTQALEGLELVAGRIIDQAFGALTAGQRDIAAELAERVLDQFPNHAEAIELRSRARAAIVTQNTAPEAAPSLAVSPQPASPGPAAVSEPEPEPEPVDPIITIYSEFAGALASGTLRPPAPDNAADLLAAMRSENPDHAMTLDAEQQMLEAILMQHNEAFDALQNDAAIAWLDTADSLGLDAERVAAARERILDFLAVQSATESISATNLTVRNYTPPVYPPNALRRGIEGWVDIAFVLSREGTPMSVEVTDASSSIFRESATSAVQQWEFEPYQIHERVVEQHAYTRIRFQLEQ